MRTFSCSFSIVSRLIIPRSATMQIDSMWNRCLQPIHHRDQRRHVGRVPRPEFAADRTSPTVQDCSHHHLLAIVAVVLAVPVLPEGLPALSLEVDRRGIEEHQLQGREQISLVCEEHLLQPVLDAPRREGRRSPLLVWRQRLSQPCHGAVEVLQLEPFRTFDGVLLAPDLRRPVAAGGEQPMEHRDEDRPLHIEAELPPFQQAADQRGEAQFFPQALEDQRRAEANLPVRRDLAAPMRREHHALLGEAGARGQQRVELPAGLEHVESAESGDDVLSHRVSHALAVNDLEVLVFPAVLNSDKHGELHIATTIIEEHATNTRLISGIINHSMALHSEISARSMPSNRWILRV